MESKAEMNLSVIISTFLAIQLNITEPTWVMNDYKVMGDRIGVDVTSHDKRYILEIKNGKIRYYQRVPLNEQECKNELSNQKI